MLCAHLNIAIHLACAILGRREPFPAGRVLSTDLLWPFRNINGTRRDDAFCIGRLFLPGTVFCPEKYSAPGHRKPNNAKCPPTTRGAPACHAAHGGSAGA